MAEVRRSREQEVREHEMREQMAREYVPPSTIPDVTPEAGFKFKWVATHVLGHHDPMNVSRNMRDGWEPVKASDKPDLAVFANKQGLIEIGGLLLCKNREEKVAARDAYYDQQARNQAAAVNAQFMRGNDPRMPLFSESRSEVSRGGSFGKGTK